MERFEACEDLAAKVAALNLADDDSSHVSDALSDYVEGSLWLSE